MRTQFVLELKDAEVVVAAGQAKAGSHGWPVSVAVVDAAGTPILVSRMNAASPASVNTAIEKARTSAMLGLPSKWLEAMVKERPALLSMDRVAVEGGVPILFQGQKLGGIGVSGVQSHEDAQVAEAGLAALMPLLG